MVEDSCFFFHILLPYVYLLRFYCSLQRLTLLAAYSIFTYLYDTTSIQRLRLRGKRLRGLFPIIPNNTLVGQIKAAFDRRKQPNVNTLARRQTASSEAIHKCTSNKKKKNPNNFRIFLKFCLAQKSLYLGQETIETRLINPDSKVTPK